ncbi:MAG TPA: VWA domain-containing protein [Thermoanaerobaculia bacterium]|nr:VWA domain-containing protein [Thermoanaerobaculia bacterium]
MRRFALTLGFALLAGLPAAAQSPQPAQAPQPPFGEEIDVRVVNVEAVVTDRQGNRVPGLQPGDFRLLVDGKEVPIEYFTEVRGGQAVTPEAPGAAGNEGRTPVVPGLASLAPGSPVGTSYLLFIDDYFSLAPRRNEVLRALQDDLGRLGPEDRMAVVAYDGGELKMLTTWSNSSREINRALQEAIARPARGIDRLTDLRTFESSRRFSAGSVPGAGMPRAATSGILSFEERNYAQELARQVADVSGAAASALRGFAAPPGRKVMLLLSGGWPLRPVDYVVNSFERTILTREAPEGEALLRPLIRTANLLGYTIYPVDVPGVEAVSADATESGGPSLGTSNVREQEIEDSLELVAARTGGRPLVNGLRAAALEQAAADTRSYYWLGFTPTWQRNDQPHAVKVEVRRDDLRGLAVRSRDSFFDVSRRAEVTMMVESAMLFGSAPGFATMPVQVGTPKRAGRGQVEVPVTVSIPADAFTPLPAEGKFAAQLELRIASVDERGGRSAIPVIPLSLAGDKPPAAGSSLTYQTSLRLRDALQHLVVALYDPVSGKITTGEVDFIPEKARRKR